MDVGNPPGWVVGLKSNAILAQLKKGVLGVPTTGFQCRHKRRRVLLCIHQTGNDRNMWRFTGM